MRWLPLILLTVSACGGAPATSTSNAPLTIDGTAVDVIPGAGEPTELATQATRTGAELQTAYVAAVCRVYTDDVCRQSQRDTCRVPLADQWDSAAECAAFMLGRIHACEAATHALDTSAGAVEACISHLEGFDCAAGVCPTPDARVDSTGACARPAQVLHDACPEPSDTGFGG